MANFTLSAEITANANSFKRAMKDAKGSLSGFDSKVSGSGNKIQSTGSKISAVGDKFKNAGGKIAGVGKTMTKMTAPLTAIVVASIKTGMNFEKSMSKVQTTIGDAGSHLDALSETARHWGRTSKFSASEVAEAMSQMGLAGLNSAEAMASIPTAVNLAQSANMGLAEATEKVTRSMNIFNLEGEESARVADLMTSMNKTADASITDFAKTFENAGTAIGMYNISLEDASMVTTLMADASLTGAQAGTAFNGMMNGLAKACRDGKLEINGVAIAFYDMDGNARPTMDILNDLRKSMAGMSDEAKAAALESMGLGEVARRGLLPILEATDDRVAYLTDRFDNASGSAEHYANIMGDNLATRMKIAKNNFKDIGITIGNILIPFIEKLVTWIQNLVGKFQALSPEQQQMIVKIGAIVAVAGPLLMIFGKIVKAIGAIIKVVGTIVTWFGKVVAVVKKVAIFVGKVGKAFLLLSNPIGWVVLAIGAVVGAFALLWNRSEAFRNFFINLWENIKAFVSSAIERIVQVVTGVIDGIKTAWSTMTDFFSGLWEAISGKVGSAIDGIRSAFDSVFKAVTNIWNAITGFFCGVMNGVRNIVNTVLNAIRTLFQNIFNAVQSIWNVLKTVFQTIFDRVRTIVETVMNTIRSILETIFNVVRGIWEGLKGVFQFIFDFVKNMIQQRFLAIQTIFQAVFGFVSGVWEGLKSVFSGIFNAVFGVIDGVMQKVRGVFETVFSGIEGAWSGLTGFVSGVANGISGAFNTVVNGVKNMVNAVTGGINSAIGIINRIPGVNIPRIPRLARGTDNWQGGFAMINEGGRGELTYLPNGAVVVPHDISVKYAQESARAVNRNTLDTNSLANQIKSMMKNVTGSTNGTIENHVTIMLDGETFVQAMIQGEIDFNRRSEVIGFA